MNKLIRSIFILLALCIWIPELTAQSQNLNDLNELNKIRSISLKNGNEVMMLKFKFRPLFELVPNLENGILTLKIFEAKSLLRRTSEEFNNSLTKSYSIKKISESEFWVLIYLKEKELDFITISERIDEGYLGFQFNNKNNADGKEKNTLLSANFTKTPEKEQLILLFENAPKYSLQEIQLPNFKLEINLPNTTVSMKKEIDSYSPDIINPVKFIEENGSTRVILEPVRFGLNYNISTISSKKALLIEYSDAPLSSQITQAEIDRFISQTLESEIQKENAKNKLFRRDFAEAEKLYRESAYQAAAASFLKLYNATQDSELGIQSRFRYSDSLYAQLNPEMGIEEQRDVIDSYLSSINLALDKGYKGTELYRGLYHIARIYQNFGYNDEALGYYQSILKNDEINPYYVEAEYFTGEIYHKKRRYKEALKIFKNFTNRFKSSRYYAYALYMIGDTYFELKDYEKSIEYFSKARTLDSRIPENYPKLLYNMAEVYLEAGFPEKSKSLYETLIVKYPDNPYIDYIAIRLGDYLRDNGQEKSAIRVYSTIINKLPQELALTARMRIANIFSEDIEGEYYQKAIDFYNFLTSNFPLTAYGEESKFRTAIVLGFQKKYDASIKAFETFLSDHPSNFFSKSGEARNKIVDVLNTAVIDNFHQNDYAAAIQYYYNYSRYTFPFNPRFEYLYVATSAEKANLNKTANEIYKLIIDDENTINKDLIMYKMIKNNLKLNNPQSAYNLMNSLIKRFPDSIYSPLSMKLKADTLYSENQVETAVDIYRQIIEKYASTPNPLLFDTVNNSLYNLGDIYRNLGKFDDARLYYVDTIENFKHPINDARVPDYFKHAVYRIGEMQYETDELEDAKISFENALRLYPNFERMPWAQYFMGQIYLRRKQPDIALNIYESLLQMADPNAPQLWVNLAREAMLEAQNKTDYLNYLKKQPGK